MSAEGLQGPESTGPVAVAPELTRWQKFRMVVKVVELRLRFIALMAATGLVFGYWDTIWNHYEKWTRPAGERVAAASDVEFFCPMHPNVVRSEPGNCPICGMPLSKRKKGEKEVLPEGVTARVALSPFRVQQAGVATMEVSYAPLAETLTTVGEVRFDERRLARISSKTKGQARVEKLLVNFTGTPVQAGEPLAELYSPELYQAVRELLLAQKNASQRVQYQSASSRTLLGDGTDLVQMAREKLGHWGLTAQQLDQILASGQADYRLPILSPISGVVIRKNVVEGQYVAEGDSLFEVADLGRVWVQAQVFEDQIGKVKLGQAVEATVTAFPGEVFRGTVAFIDPALNPETRTVNVRYDLENGDGRLRPGMYATVTLRTPVSEMPAFRERLARRPAAGPARIQKASFTTPAEQKICPVTGSELGSMGDPLPVKLASGQIWICCEGCQTPLEGQPDKYLPKLARTEWTVEQQEICPVTRAKLGSMGAPLAVEVENQKLWVCCAGCPEKLKAEPARYLAALEPAPKDAVLTVPESAVIDTGTRKIVYIEAEPGTFEGREVVLGPRSGELFPVLEGLVPGDRVATAGSFLIDAETRLNPGAAATYVGSSGSPKRNDAPARSASTSEAGHRH
jgi:Cu(I)/Ag(I) efflux system membrane fusion protein